MSEEPREREVHYFADCVPKFRYRKQTMKSVQDRIRDLKAQLGPETLILGHHYQRAGIVELADKLGDSFGLAKAAALETRAKNIVFCGVRFMAESAAILCRDDQRVFHPEPEAGCPMADMAPMDSVEYAWQTLTSRADFSGRTMKPVTYMNSHAPLKGFTGRHHGVVCTSSNAQKTLEWAWSESDLILFFPDAHLGRNTAKAMGLKDEEIVVWYPSRADGGIESLRGVKLILWNGHCPVHMKFTLRDVNFIRENFPESKIIVHPECTSDVVQAADAVGSTEFIVKYVQGLPDKTRVFIGTEINLVDRLRKENPKLRIEALFRSLCPTMYKVNLEKLEKTLLSIRDNSPDLEAVPMPPSIKAPARAALEKMLELTGN